MAHDPERYARLVGLGLCGRCGKAAAKPGWVHCNDCRLLNQATQKARAARRKEEGRCISCNAPADKGTKCSACAAKVVAASRRRRQRLRRTLQCNECGREIEHSRSGRVTCERCAHQRALRLRRWRARRKAAKAAAVQEQGNE